MGRVWRGVAASCALTAAVVAGAVTATQDSAADSATLLPDLREMPPGCREGTSPGVLCDDWDVCLVEDPQAPNGPCGTSGKAARIRFTSSVDNVGDGPFLLYGHRDNTGTPTMAVRQAFQTSEDGPIPQAFGAAQRVIAGSMYYEPAVTHEHWHYLDFEHFELRSTNGVILVRDRKNGFCSGDRYPAYDAFKLRHKVEDGEDTPQGELSRRLTGNLCGHHEPEALDVFNGISVGKGENYNFYVDYQWLDITGVPSGVYDLVATSNPNRQLLETRYDNNTASTAVSIDWPAAPAATITAAPVVKIIRTCPGTARCAVK